MTYLSLYLLGPFQVTLDGTPVTAFESDKVRALLAYLAVEADRPHSRDKLAGLLWPDWPDRDARSNLRYALSNLRKAIGDRPESRGRPDTVPFLHVTRQTIQFNAESEAWVDVTTFVNLLDTLIPTSKRRYSDGAPLPPSKGRHSDGAPDPTVRALEEAVALYRGEFLEGFSIGDSVPFEEWVLLERERMHRHMLSALHRLAATYERRDEYDRAMPHAWRQVELEPWQEKAHRQLMRLLALDGQRGTALAQYEACRRALAEELKVAPAPETTRLYEQIRDGEASLGHVEGPAWAHETMQTPTASLPLAQDQPPGQRTVGVRAALVGSAILLLAIAIMQALILFGTPSPFEKRHADSTASLELENGESAPPHNIMAPPEGKIVRPCEDVTPPQICVYETHTGHLAQVTEDLAFPVLGDLAWSPDGQQIVFDAAPDLKCGQPHTFNLYVIAVPNGPDADAGDVRQLTDGDTSDNVPVWSPDGARIAFNRDRELWIIHPDGSEPRRLYGESDERCVGEVQWSPNGRRIAFVVHECAPDFVPQAVWVINRDGTEPQMLHAFERRPDHAGVSWDQNGRAIVCAQVFGDQGTRLLLIDAVGIDEPYPIDELPFWWAPNYWPQWRRER